MIIIYVNGSGSCMNMHLICRMKIWYYQILLLHIEYIYVNEEAK